MSNARAARCASLTVRVAIVTTRTHAYAARFLYSSALPSEFYSRSLHRTLPVFFAASSPFFCLCICLWSWLSLIYCCGLFCSALVSSFALLSSRLLLCSCLALCSALVSSSVPLSSARSQSLARRVQPQHMYMYVQV